LPIAAGDTFLTPVLTTTTVYYVWAGLACPSARMPDTAFIFTPPVVNLGADVMTGAATYDLDAGAGFATYQWTPFGQTTQLITTDSTGDYCVTVTDTNTCSDTDCVHIDFFTGISEADNRSGISVYPNPSNGAFTIRLTPALSKGEGAMTVSITNMLGEIVYTNKYARLLSEEINLSHLTAGVYSVEIKGEHVHVHHTIIITAYK
jgi:hypothetical protein